MWPPASNPSITVDATRINSPRGISIFLAKRKVSKIQSGLLEINMWSK